MNTQSRKREVPRFKAMLETLRTFSSQRRRMKALMQKSRPAGTMSLSSSPPHDQPFFLRTASQEMCIDLRQLWCQGNRLIQALLRFHGQFGRVFAERVQRVKVQTKICLAFGAAMVGIFLLAGAGLMTTRSLINSDREVAHTLETTGELQDFLIASMDAEMQRCQLVATGDRQARSRCDLLLQEMEWLRRKIGGVAAADPHLRARLARLDRLLERRLAFFQESFNQALPKPEDAASQRATVLKGRELLDEIQIVIGDLKQVEAAELEARSTRAGRTGQLTGVLLGTGGLFSLIVTGFTLAILRRELAGREQLTGQLQQANRYNRSLIEASLDALVTIGPNGKVMDVNAATEAMTGCSRTELIGTDFSDYFTEPERARAAYERCFQEEAVRDYPLELRNRAGRVTPVLYNAAVYRDGEGEVTGVFAAARDVTALNQSLAALAESGALFRAVFEQAAAGMAQVGLDGRWLRVNQRFCDIVCYSEEDLLQKNFQDITHPYDLATDLAAVDQLLSGKKVTVTLEKRYIRKDHLSVDVHLSLSLVRTLTGEPCYFVVVIEEITERKLAEAALRRSEAVLMEGQRLAGMGSWEWNPGNDRVTWSPEMFNLFGRDPKSGPADFRAAADYFTDESWVRLRSAVEHARTTGTPFELDVEVVRPDGTHRWTTSRGEILGDLNGRVVGLRGTLVDITRRKQAELALQLAQFSVDHLSDAVAWLKPDASILRVNEAATRLLGCAREELLAMTAHDVNPALPPAAWAEHWRELRQKKVLVFEAACRAKDGRLIPVEITANHLEFEGHEFNCSCIRDMTARKQADAELHRTRNLLAEGQRIAHLGSWEYLAETQATFWSEEQLRIYGLNPAGPSPNFQVLLRNHIHPDDAAGLEETFRQCRQDCAVYEQEHRIVRPDGSVRIVQELARPYFGDHGKLVKYVGTTLDITERKQAEADVRRLNAELEERVRERTAELTLVNRELESFAYSVSHDLRTPLRAIDGFSRVVIEDCAGQLDARGRENLERVRMASQRMSQLIDDLLKLSQITRREISRQRVDLSTRALALANELQQGAPDRQVEFVIEPSLVVLADAALMEVVLGNLLGNAWKFTSKQSAAKIEFGATPHAGLPAYFVRDNGAGFDMTYANKLFGAFQRLHSLAEFPGTGIGLATVQRVIHRHHGRVWAQAEVGRGATFYFTLPTNHNQNHERQSHAPGGG